ncbi:MAG: hypothetical protein ACK4PK_03735 [Alphaproteobacteria bacterium]
MSDTEQSAQDISARERAGDIIKVALQIQDDAEAADMLDGQLMARQAYKDPELYFATAEAFFEARRFLPVVTVWRIFTECLQEHAHEFAQDAERYAAAVTSLQGFVLMFQSEPEAFAPFDLFSDKINAAIDDFDEVTIGDRPAERFRNDRLLNGDRALEFGDELAAAKLYKKAAEEDGKTEGWLRLLQLMAEADLGPGFGLSAAQDVCDKAVAAGIWYARAYYLQRLTSADSQEAGVGVVSGERRAEMSAHTRAFLKDLLDYAKPMGPATGFSKYLSPVVRPDSVLGIFSQQTPEDVLARLSAASRANSIKSAVGAFLTVAVFMRRCGWVSAEDIADLPKALDLFDALLAEESAQVAETKLQASPVAEGSFEAEQEIFHDMAIELNAQISTIIAEARLFLSESV